MNPHTHPERPLTLVTGASRGIGAAIAITLADQGHDVAMLSVDDASETAHAVEARGARALAVQGDLADIAGHAGALDRITAWAGRAPSCLVNNAGIGSPRRGDLLEVQPQDFDRVLDVNLRGTFFLTQAVARRMLAHTGGHPRSIVTISSVSAEMASIERGDYCLSKSGLAMMTRLFALRLAPLGIGVFELRPGVIRTAMTEPVAARYEQRIEEGLVPMARWGEPQDIAEVVAALATGRLAFSTGSVIHVDGALSVPRL